MKTKIADRPNINDHHVHRTLIITAPQHQQVQKKYRTITEICPITISMIIQIVALINSSSNEYYVTTHARV